ncbi:PREDICTED: protein CREG1 [Dufourea novaeangliae]|uniref:Protein CREG1 n=1 Tax=Dufourea novaeangliae TaxID=178035 RepID=A0A154P2H7_DUFNO|nr:PREDICTED: protein CREG1 [Dufourea novaeangliae]KZC05320.1 Protein CREG1 [Dufourea novaeangliae]
MILRVTIFVALLSLAIEAHKYPQTLDEREQWKEFEEFQEWKKAKQFSERRYENKYKKWHPDNENHDVDKVYERNEKIPNANPPSVDEAALMARYIVNQADWVSVATISTRKEIESSPAVTLVSFSDGELGNGSGIPYLYLTPLDFTAQDLAKDNRASMMMTLAQGDYCKSKQWDPMDPRCARVLLSGRVKTLKNESAELETAKKVFFARHPKLRNMPPNHNFYFAKLKITSIAVLDTFGGPKYVTTRDYLHPPVNNVTEEFNRLFPLQSSENDSQQEYMPISNYLNPVVRNV